MTTLKQFIQEIMDLPQPKEEAEKKLVGTYMIVNGTPELIKGFDYVQNTVITNNKIIKVKTIAPWLPESGLYITKKGDPWYITKVPKRQWLKSFAFSFYEIQDLSGWVEDPKLEDVHECKRVSIGVDKCGQIFHNKTHIGYIEKSNIVCTNSLYEQELRDWNNYDLTH
jgi:hypothetical protein